MSLQSKILREVMKLPNFSIQNLGCETNMCYVKAMPYQKNCVTLVSSVVIIVNLIPV